MNPLAKILIDMGYTVSGSDVKENVYTLRLKEMGAQIFYGHNESNIRTADLIVVSSAIKDTNIEYQAAKNTHLTIIKRAQLLSFIMDRHHIKVAVAGTHGKTTTTSFLSHFLYMEGKDPTYVIGAPLKQLKTASHYGRDEYFIAEADESDRSFLFLNPNVIVITNIEEEHLDEYKNLEDIMQTFNKLIQRMPKNNNLLIACGDDPNIRELEVSGINVISYGFNEGNIIRAVNLRTKTNKVYYDVYAKDELITESVALNIPGKHNILNSLVVFAFAYYYRQPIANVVNSFQTFEGASRRFHLVGKVNNIDIYDDYAHHPTEIKCTLEAAKSYGKRIVAIFQPHRYSRFCAFFEKFSQALNIADFIIITDVYSAGEVNTTDLDSKKLCATINADKVLYVKNVGDIAGKALPYLKPNDLVITLGAGDITHVSKELYQLLKSQD